MSSSAASARDEADVLVTEDKTLQKRIRREDLNVTILTFEEFRRHVLDLAGVARRREKPWR